MKIEKVDSNFKFGNIRRDDLLWIDGSHPCVQINGAEDINSFYRISEENSLQMRENVRHLSTNTSGVRMRFCTDSDYIALKAVLRYPCDMPHMPKSGSSGFDLYAAKNGESMAFRKIFMPEGLQLEVSGEYSFGNSEIREILINFPLYNGVTHIELDLSQDAVLQPPARFTYKDPIVFYGSSITQGGCASRPGNSYTAILCRDLNVDFINLGFSGNAKGEPEMAEYIAHKSMSVFVMDYDHNADSPESLKATHAAFFNIIRKTNPHLPVIFISRPDFDCDKELNAVSREIIYDTYRQALESGDNNVWFIDGETLFGEHHRDSCTVDGCHPNDLGFMRMAEKICPVIREVLGKK